jgi:hypothetical protein
MTSEIDECTIESDDFGETVWNYSDSELRCVPFCLKDKIKRVEHIWNDAGTAIIETRIAYRISIKKSQVLDLNRALGWERR